MQAKHDHHNAPGRLPTGGGSQAKTPEARPRHSHKIAETGGIRSDPLVYNCVDAATEILTTRGWLRHDQVAAGDTALTLDQGTGIAEWRPVQSVHEFGDGPYPVVNMKSLRHSSVTTPDHRWPVMFAHRKAGYNGWAWRTTQSMPWDARVAAAAPYRAPEQPKWPDALAELVAWFWTEGWIGEHGQVTITQSGAANPCNVARIRAALVEVFGPDARTEGRSLLGSRDGRRAIACGPSWNGMPCVVTALSAVRVMLIPRRWHWSAEERQMARAGPKMSATGGSATSG